MSVHAAFPDATMNTYNFDLDPPLPPIPSSSTLVVEGGSREQWATFFEGVDVTSGLLDIGSGQSSQAACQSISGTAFTDFGFVQQRASVLDIEQFLGDDALPPNLFAGLSGEAVPPARDDDRATFDFGDFISSTASQDLTFRFSPEDKALFGLPPSPSPQGPQPNVKWPDESPQEYALGDFVNAPTQCLNDSPCAFDDRWEIDTPSKDFASEPLPRSGLDDYPGPSTLARNAPRGTLQPYVADDLGDGPYASAPFLDALHALPGPDFTFDDDPFQPGPSNRAEYPPMDWPSLPTTSSYGDFLEPVIPEALPRLPTGTQALDPASSSNPALGPLEESGAFAWSDYNKHQQYQQQQVAAAHLPVPALPACPPVPLLAPASSLLSDRSKRRIEDTPEAGPGGIRTPKKKKTKANKENPNESNMAAANTVDPGTSTGLRQPLVDQEQAAASEATSAQSTDNLPPPEDTVLRFGIFCPHPNLTGGRCNEFLIGGLKSLGDHIEREHGGLPPVGVDGRRSCPLIKAANSTETCGKRFNAYKQAFSRHTQAADADGHFIEGQYLDDNNQPVGAVVRHPIYGCPLSGCEGETFAQYFGGRKDSVKRHLEKAKPHAGKLSKDDVNIWSNKLRLAQYDPKTTQK